MVSPEILEMYNKYMPRWFKVIRWRFLAMRYVETAKYTWIGGYIPILYGLFIWANPYPMLLCIKQPQTDEERLALKRNCYNMPLQRNWEIGQYQHERPPYMDLWKRRRNYPEYYEGKYDGYRQDNVYYQQDTLANSGIAPPKPKKA